jgi:molybdopterin/thiamine biosynthesis adenylyltransferase
VSIVKEALGSAVILIEEGRGERNLEDFRQEFLSYWPIHAAPIRPGVLSLIEPGPPSRAIRVARLKTMILAGEDDATLLQWLAHRSGSGTPKRQALEDAVLLWLRQPLLPTEYPRSAADVLTLAQQVGPDCEQLLRECAPDLSRCIVVLGSRASNGPCLAAVALSPPSRSTSPGHKGADPLSRGFRTDKTPRALLERRYFGAQKIAALEVDRADATWVHGRGADPGLARLRASRVAIIGCGSVGAPVALALAQAGVGRLLLVDPDVLKTANIGRHPLGADALGRNKAEALAAMIRSKLPHLLSVDGHGIRWDQFVLENAGSLVDCDLIVAATGEWSTEGGLNEWHLGVNRAMPVLYGWTEAHACAGHAVAVCSSGGCLQCGFSRHGRPTLQVTEWKGGSTDRQEPACGTSYQPYGPVALGHVTSIVAELAVDCLLGDVVSSTERIWAGRRALLHSAGGDWTAEWLRIAGTRVEGGFIEDRPWGRTVDCVECASAAA